MGLLKQDVDNIKNQLNQAQEEVRSKEHEVMDLTSKVEQLTAEVSAKESELAEVGKIVGASEGGVAVALHKLKEEVAATESARTEYAEIERKMKRYQAIAEEDPNYQWLSILDDSKSMRMRQLAMAAGTSAGKLKPFVSQLVDSGLLALEDGDLDDGDPVVKLVE